MDLTIPQKIINETTKCEDNFSCLKSELKHKSPACPVDYANGENVLFLKNFKWIPCPYQLTFGYAMVCSCPVHFELYNRKLEKKRKLEEQE